MLQLCPRPDPCRPDPLPAPPLQSSSEEEGGSTSCSVSSSGASEAGSDAEPVPGEGEAQPPAADVLGPLRRHRRRRSGRSVGEIAAGPVPERLRRRSEVGSVLELEAQSDTEDAELALQAAHLTSGAL